MPANKSEASTEKKWIGWFRPLSRGFRRGSLVAVPILIYKEPHGAAGNIVVSVPSSCGTAVQRNRFRRIVKARFANCVLRKEIVADETLVLKKENVESARGLTANKSLSSKRAVKGIWIRLLNRHRLGRKILLEDWQKDFDAIELAYC